MAVTARVATVERESAVRHTGTIRRVRVKRRSRTRVPKFLKPLLLASTLVFLFCYVNVYANLAVTGYSKSKLMEMCRQEKIRNERLKVELTARSSPHSVVIAAQKAGMVYATQYDYLQKSETVASAVEGR